MINYEYENYKQNFDLLELNYSDLLYIIENYEYLKKKIIFKIIYIPIF